jgi:aminopeptidase YwaD
MQRVFHLILILLLAVCSSAQVYNDSLASKANKIDSVLQYIYQFESFGPKPIGSIAIDEARDWITLKYQSLGYNVVIDTFQNSGKQCYNIIIEKFGSDSSKWIVVGAHYDTVEDSPGANDNGTGVSACLRMAKIIKDVDTKYSIRIINFSSEETGFDGSQHYVNNTLNNKDSVLLMFNLDQLGGTKGQDNSKIKCERDEDDNPSANNALSYLKTDTLYNLMALYTSLTPVISRAYSSDYVPFENKGMIITGLYQESDFPQYHTSQDVTANVDINAATEVIKGATAAVLFFAKMRGIGSSNGIKIRLVKLYPNPTRESFIVQTPENNKVNLVLKNAIGQEVFRVESFTNTPISILHLSSGVYSVSISNLEDGYLSNATLIIAP